MTFLGMLVESEIINEAARSLTGAHRWDASIARGRFNRLRHSK